MGPPGAQGMTGMQTDLSLKHKLYLGPRGMRGANGAAGMPGRVCFIL